MKQEFSFYSEEKVMVTLPRKWWQLWMSPTTQTLNIHVRKAAILRGDFTDFINDPKFREIMLALYPTMHNVQLEDVLDLNGLGRAIRVVDGVRHIGSRRVKKILMSEEK